MSSPSTPSRSCSPPLVVPTPLDLEKDLESELTCPVCLEIFDQPHRLECDHTFCQRCLQKLVKSDSTILVCPACRTFTTLKLPGFLGVARLPVDFRVSRLVRKYACKTAAANGDNPGQEYKGPDDTEDLTLPFEHIEVSPCCEVVHGYVPFALAMRRTRDMFETWKKNLWLCPTDFPQKATLKHVRMVSVPFYVFSVNTHVRFKAEVSCPQDGKSSLPPSAARTEVTKSRTSALIPPNNDPCSNHPSRRWIQFVIGSTVTQRTVRETAVTPDQGWRTLLWSTLSTIVPRVGGAARQDGCARDPACTAAPTPPCKAAPYNDDDTSSTDSTSQDDGTTRPIPGLRPPKGQRVLVDNLEICSKVGQTYISSTQSMQRKLKYEGVHTNEFTNIVVCASYAIDHDLVAALMKGRSKDEDLQLSQTSLVKLDPPAAGNNEGYLQKILTLVQQDSAVSGSSGAGAEGGGDVGRAAAEGIVPLVDGDVPLGRGDKRKKKKQKKKEKPTYNDPAKVYEELLSAPPTQNNSSELFPDFLTYPDRSSVQDDEINDFFDTNPLPAAAATATSSTSSSSSSGSSSVASSSPPAPQTAPPPLSTARPASLAGPAVFDDLDFTPPAPPQHHHLLTPTGSDTESPATDGAGRLLAAALEKEDYFATRQTDAQPSGECVMQSEPEILAPERRSEDAWVEQIWPHIHEKEVEFTQSVVHSMESKGAVVLDCTLELTVTELKQRAILIPCYIATYMYEGRQYDALIHGRTGEVHGKRPWLGSKAYDKVKREVERQVTTVRTCIEESLDHLGVT